MPGPQKLKEWKPQTDTTCLVLTSIYSQQVAQTAGLIMDSCTRGDQVEGKRWNINSGVKMEVYIRGYDKNFIAD